MKAIQNNLHKEFNLAQEIGETRAALAERLLSSTLFKAIDKTKKHRPNTTRFYIFITAKQDKFLTNVLRQGVKVSTTKPPRMLNSMCFYVDTKKGLLRNEWVLPLDTGNAHNALIGDEESQLIMNSIKGMENILA